jgi:hypothetical protein
MRSHPLAFLADVIRRRVDHRQHLGAASAGQFGRLLEPGVLADEQADVDTARLEHAGALPRREVAALVEHLVVGQFALGVGLEDAAFLDDAGRVVAQLHGHRLAAHAAAGRMPDHHVQSL